MLSSSLVMMSSGGLRSTTTAPVNQQPLCIEFPGGGGGAGQQILTRLDQMRRLVYLCVVKCPRISHHDVLILRTGTKEIHEEFHLFEDRKSCDTKHLQRNLTASDIPSEQKRSLCEVSLSFLFRCCFPECAVVC